MEGRSMERLTFEVHDGGFFVKESDVKTFSVEDEVMHTGNAIRKLAEYEDLEEQGLLLKLPCPFGTKVFYVQKCQAPSCKTCLGFTKVSNCYCEYKGRIFEQRFSYRHLRAFGKTVFLTQAEAEEALRKMNETEE